MEAVFEMQEIIKIYKKTKNISEVARQTGKCRIHILKILRKVGLKSKKKNMSYARGNGKNHHNWKGGKLIAWNGYIRIHKPDHPRALSNGYVWEHILVAEKKLRRPLRYFGKGHSKNENIHHINGNKTDNRPKNLEVFSTNSKHVKHEWKNNPEKFPQSGLDLKRFKNWKKKNQYGSGF